MFVVVIDRRNLLEKSSHVSCYIIKKNTSIRMFFLQNEEIQNQPRLVKIYGSIDTFCYKETKEFTRIIEI